MFKKTRWIDVNQRDMMEVIRVIIDHLGAFEGFIGACDWTNDPDIYSVSFDANDKRYGKIVEELNNMGEFKVVVSPKGGMNVFFERI